MSTRQVCALLCVVSQYQEYSSGRGSAGRYEEDGPTHSSSFRRSDNQLELTTAFMMSSVADVNDSCDHRHSLSCKTAAPNGRCPSVSKASPTRSTSINSFTFHIPILRDGECRVDKDDEEEEGSLAIQGDDFTETSETNDMMTNTAVVAPNGKGNPS